MPLKLIETNVSSKRSRLENRNWREADQLAIYKYDSGVELGRTRFCGETTSAEWSERGSRISSPAP